MGQPFTDAHQTLEQPRSRSERINAFWCRIPSRGNFGDILTPWLIKRISGQSPLFVRPDAPVTKYFVSGSIVEYSRENCVIWGAGIMARSDHVSSKAMFLAVRGPLTRDVALASGAECPEVYGDPALLLPRFYQPQNARRQGIGIIPHFSDKPRLMGHRFCSEDVRLIDIQSPVESFIEQVCSCEFVISSSLHGIIVSHAYGIPAAWIKFRDLPSGDDSKFLDYFMSIGRMCVEPLPAHFIDARPSQLIEHTFLPLMCPDLERLWRACPFR